jgi:hypothetical protein
VGSRSRCSPGICNGAMGTPRLRRMGRRGVGRLVGMSRLRGCVDVYLTMRVSIAGVHLHIPSIYSFRPAYPLPVYPSASVSVYPLPHYIFQVNTWIGYPPWLRPLPTSTSQHFCQRRLVTATADVSPPAGWDPPPDGIPCLSDLALRPSPSLPVPVLDRNPAVWIPTPSSPASLPMLLPDGIPAGWVPYTLCPPCLHRCWMGSPPDGNPAE